MLLKERINKDIVVAMKNKDNNKRDVLRVLKGEIDRSESKTDEDVVSLVKKMVDNIKTTTNDSNEVDILQVYLPRQLSDDEITNLVNEQIDIHGYSSPKEMGSLMTFFKENYNGQYDGKQLSLIVRERLK